MKYSLPQPFHPFGCRLTAHRLIPSLKWEARRVKGGWELENLEAAGTGQVGEMIPVAAHSIAPINYRSSLVNSYTW